MSNNQTILDKAKEIIYNDRNSQYGHPADNFDKIARVVSILLRKRLKSDLTAEDVALIMMVTKLCRNSNKFDLDNLIDLCGYAGCIEMIKNKDDV